MNFVLFCIVLIRGNTAHWQEPNWKAHGTTGCGVPDLMHTEERNWREGGDCKMALSAAEVPWVF